MGSSYISHSRYNFIIALHGAGRKPTKCGMRMAEAMKMEEQGIDKSRIAGQMGVSMATYYRKRKKYLEEMD